MNILRMAVVAALVAAAPAAAADSQQRTITVSGTSSLTVVNDTAGFVTGVTVRRSSPGVALRSASAATSRVLHALEAAGVAAGDLRTDDVSVHAVRRHHVLVYVASNLVHVVVRKVTSTGAVIDAAVNAGATRLSGLTFWRSRSADVYRQALVAALRNARGKAQALAQDSNATLGDVQSIEESTVDTYNSSESASAGTGLPSPRTPTHAGRTKVTATLTAVFALQ
jgi:uncharacterized protein YggE